MQISEARLNANRANAAKSTGPKSLEGKARSAQNAMRHGLLAKQILIGDESAENFQALIDLLSERFAPIDPFELNLIEELAASYWRMRRSWAMEKEMLESAMRHHAGSQIARTAAAFGQLANHPKLALLHRYETRLHLMYQRALNTLLRLRKAKNSTPAAAPATPSAMPNEPKTPFACNQSPEPDPPRPAPATPPNHAALSPVAAPQPSVRPPAPRPRFSARRNLGRWTGRLAERSLRLLSPFRSGPALQTRYV